MQLVEREIKSKCEYVPQLPKTEITAKKLDFSEQRWLQGREDGTVPDAADNL
jgi:hypothetical protein